MVEDDNNASLVGSGPPQAGSINDLLQQNSSRERSETGNNNTEEIHNSTSSWDEMVANHERISYTLEQSNTGIPEIDEGGEGFLDNKSRLVSDVNDNNERSISFKDDATPDDEFDEYNKHFRQSTVSFAMNANRLAEGEEYDEDDDDTNALRPGTRGVGRNYNSRRESNRSNISALTESEVKRKRLSMWKFESYELPQSTYTLLISEPVLSRAFLMGIVAAVLSIMSLSIVLVSELDNGTADSPLGLPTGVPPEVRMAQYLGKFMNERGAFFLCFLISYYVYTYMLTFICYIIHLPNIQVS